MSTCDEMFELISAALDGALTAEEQRRVDAHLAECPACAALFQDLSTMEVLFGDPIEEAPEGFAQSVMDRIRQNETDHAVPVAPPKRNVRRNAYLAAAAVFAVVLIGYGSVHLTMDDRNSTATCDMASVSTAESAASDESTAEDENETFGSTVTGEGTDTGNSDSDAQYDDTYGDDSRSYKGESGGVAAAAGSDTAADPERKTEATDDSAAGRAIERSAETTEGSDAGTMETAENEGAGALQSTEDEDAGIMETEESVDIGAMQVTEDEDVGETEENTPEMGFAAMAGGGGGAAEEIWCAKIELTGTVPDILEAYEYTQTDTTRYYTVPAEDMERLEEELTALGYDITVTREGSDIDQTAENGVVVVTVD